jgi:hypothetical protein
MYIHAPQHDRLINEEVERFAQALLDEEVRAITKDSSGFDTVPDWL